MKKILLVTIVLIGVIWLIAIVRKHKSHFYIRKRALFLKIPGGTIPIRSFKWKWQVAYMLLPYEIPRIISFSSLTTPSFTLKLKKELLGYRIVNYLDFSSSYFQIGNLPISAYNCVIFPDRKFKVRSLNSKRVIYELEGLF